MADVVAQEITFSNGVKAPNRFLKSAMTERLCTWGLELSDRGHPTEQYRHLYELWGKGGTGIIVFGNVPCGKLLHSSVADHLPSQISGN